MRKHTPNVMSANGNEDPSSVVKFMLAIRVKNKLTRSFDQLANPFDLHATSEASAFHII